MKKQNFTMALLKLFHFKVETQNLLVIFVLD